MFIKMMKKHCDSYIGLLRYSRFVLAEGPCGWLLKGLRPLTARIT